MFLRSGAAVVVALVAAFALSASGCDTREAQGRETGLRGRAEVARACATVSSDACRQSACQAVCAPVEYDVPHQRCEDTCLGTGTCDGDRDCIAPLRCIQIAPVVRRCGLVPDAGATPSPQ